MKKYLLLATAALVLTVGAATTTQARDPGAGQIGEKQLVERNRGGRHYRGGRGRGRHGGGLYFSFGSGRGYAPRRYVPRHRYYAPPPAYYYAPPPAYYYPTTPGYGGTVIIR